MARQPAHLEVSLALVDANDLALVHPVAGGHKQAAALLHAVKRVGGDLQGTGGVQGGTECWLWCLRICTGTAGAGACSGRPSPPRATAAAARRTWPVSWHTRLPFSRVVISPTKGVYLGEGGGVGERVGG